LRLRFPFRWLHLARQVQNIRLVAVAMRRNDDCGDRHRKLGVHCEDYKWRFGKRLAVKWPKREREQVQIVLAPGIRWSEVRHLRADCTLRTRAFERDQ
jgi:hypothetical protein